MSAISLFRNAMYGVLQRFTPKRTESNTLQVSPKSSVYDIPLVDIHGKSTSLRTYQGKRILIVNVASECGYTPQYAQLQELHDNHKHELAILAFPCNQFGTQEPGDEEQIVAFCSRAYGVKFPMFKKIFVSGKNQHPLYRWLTDPKLNGWNRAAPDWNFCKFVIAADGSLLHFFSPSVSPFDKRILG